MGQFSYLINKEERICCECCQISASGNSTARVVNMEALGRFLEYCRENNLQIECVDEHWFEARVNLETEEPYKDFK